VQDLLTVELGDRAVEGLQLENVGVVVQRLDTIHQRRPRCGWRYVRGDGGAVVSMVWCQLGRGV
jgi:hypothetical protein